jgi:hypothetical protein
MAGLLFVSQAMLDSWAGQGRIDFVGNVMTLLAGDGRGRSYALDPAVRFLSLLGADTDPNQLLRKVKSIAQLRELGAEAVDSSVILGDVAYEVEPGFLAEMSALQAAAAAKPDPARVASRGGTVPPAPAPAPPAAPAGAAARAPSAATPGAPSASPAPPGPAPASPYASAPLPRDLEERRKEAEALARFLLDNLS